MRGFWMDGVCGSQPNPITHLGKQVNTPNALPKYIPIIARDY